MLKTENTTLCVQYSSRDCYCDAAKHPQEQQSLPVLDRLLKPDDGVDVATADEVSVVSCVG